MTLPVEASCECFVCAHGGKTRARVVERFVMVCCKAGTQDFRPGYFITMDHNSYHSVCNHCQFKSIDLIKQSYLPIETAKLTWILKLLKTNVLLFWMFPSVCSSVFKATLAGATFITKVVNIFDALQCAHFLFFVFLRELLLSADFLVSSIPLFWNPLPYLSKPFFAFPIQYGTLFVLESFF